MKIFLISTIVLLSMQSALAGHFFCTAEGYHISSGKLMSVSGEEKPTEKEAEESALRMCRMYGYSACQVSSCFQMGWDGVSSSEDFAR